MKIYQLHEHSGEWEDYRDRIIGSYLRKERAEEEKTKAEWKEKELIEQSEKCSNCPFIGENTIEDVNHLFLVEYPNYCDKAILETDEYGTSCENSYLHWYKASFKIEEVEVEE